VLFLLGSVGLLLYNVNRMPAQVRDQVNVSVILDDAMSDRDAMPVLAQIELKKYVRTAEYKSKEDAAREMQADLGSDFIALLGENPLPARIEFKLHNAWVSTEKIEEARREILQIKGVKEVRYQKSLLETVVENLRKISILVFVFAGLLMFVSIFLINNTIRLAIYSKRFLINTMKLVGANSSFIRTPFLASSVWQGLASGFISILMLLALILFLRADFSEILELTDAKMFGTLFAIMLMMGSLISFVSTYIIVTKYTKVGADDLWES
jgi:cell division transport system permease protein